MTSYAPGSLKLFGEHAVIHDRVGVSAAFDKFARVSLFEPKGHTRVLELNLLDLGFTASISEKDLKESHKQLDYLFSKKDIAGIAKLRKGNVALPFYYLVGCVFAGKGFIPLRIEVSSTVPRSSGLGSSSAIFAALASELNAEFRLGFGKKEMADLANKGDAVVHGNPSGIDVSTCIYGGFLKFKRSEGVAPLTIKTRVPALIVNTGVSKDTGAMIAKVSKQLSDDKLRVAAFFDNMETAAFAGLDALKEGDLQKLGAELDRGQKMFKELGLTTRETDEIISLAKAHKAYGAKITGAGGGGCVLVIAEKPSKLVPIFTKAGYPSFETNLGPAGARHGETIA